MQARRAELVDVLDLPGLVAERGGACVGILTYAPHDHEVEIAFLEAVDRRAGIGTALLDAFLAAVTTRPVWLVTTNDNLDALRFYQRRGFVIRQVRAGAVTRGRDTIKPSLGRTGEYGIEIRDEIELEYR
jgi:ribosomal protein S18 acetylase RimI-like enzyme